LVGRVFYRVDDQASNEEDRHKQLACSKLPPMQFDNDPDLINSPILMVDRGKCSFVQKVRHAQDIGAAAVLIVDNKPGEDIEHIIMSDDGTGGNLYIPAILISYEDGEIIKRYLSNNAYSKNVAM
jgi:hypothetical protein